VREWTPICEAIARTATRGIFYPGAGPEDVLQEARIGVHKALGDFRPGGGASFETFAAMCARRQVLTGLKLAQRGKHRVLSDAISFDTPANEDGTVTVGDLIVSPASDPCRIVVARDEALRLLARLGQLTPWERECVERALIGGEEYGQVGPVKSVDNAVQRARRKLAAADRPRAHRRVVKVYVDRSVFPTERQAVTQALGVREGVVVSIAKRKLLDGRERAPQGRPTADGRRGLPVWRVEIREAA
jgi:RNA polymerase sporulation-specific sigma factor